MVLRPRGAIHRRDGWAAHAAATLPDGGLCAADAAGQLVILSAGGENRGCVYLSDAYRLDDPNKPFSPCALAADLFIPDPNERWTWSGGGGLQSNSGGASMVLFVAEQSNEMPRGRPRLTRVTLRPDGSEVMARRKQFGPDPRLREPGEICIMDRGGGGHDSAGGDLFSEAERAAGREKRLLVSDTALHTVLVLDADKLRCLCVLGGDSKLDTPFGVACCGEEVFVAEQGTHRISVYSCAADRSKTAAMDAFRQQMKSSSLTAPLNGDGASADDDGGAADRGGATSGVASLLADAMAEHLIVSALADDASGMFLRVRMLGTKGVAPGQFRRPRGVTVLREAGEPLLVVAEAKRVQVVTIHGEPRQVIEPSERAGTLWGVSTSWDGATVYVTDGQSLLVYGAWRRAKEIAEAATAARRALEEQAAQQAQAAAREKAEAEAAEAAAKAAKEKEEAAKREAKALEDAAAAAAAAEAAAKRLAAAEKAREEAAIAAEAKAAARKEAAKKSAKEAAAKAVKDVAAKAAKAAADKARVAAAAKAKEELADQILKREQELRLREQYVAKMAKMAKVAKMSRRTSFAEAAGVPMPPPTQYAPPPPAAAAAAAAAASAPPPSSTRSSRSSSSSSSAGPRPTSAPSASQARPAAVDEERVPSCSRDGAGAWPWEPAAAEARGEGAAGGTSAAEDEVTGWAPYWTRARASGGYPETDGSEEEEEEEEEEGADEEAWEEEGWTWGAWRWPWERSHSEAEAEAVAAEMAAAAAEEAAARAAAIGRRESLFVEGAGPPAAPDDATAPSESLEDSRAAKAAERDAAVTRILLRGTLSLKAAMGMSLLASEGEVAKRVKHYMRLLHPDFSINQPLKGTKKHARIEAAFKKLNGLREQSKSK